MAADGTPGAKNQPQFLGSGAPASAADLNIISNYAALGGNTKTGTNSDRLGLAAADMWDGLIYECTDTGVNWLRLAGAWVPHSLRPMNAASTLIQHGRTTVVTDANGLFNAQFGTAFPSACDRVIAVSADLNYAGAITFTGATNSFWSGRATTPNLGFNVDWIAVGR